MLFSVSGNYFCIYQIQAHTWNLSQLSVLFCLFAYFCESSSLCWLTIIIITTTTTTKLLQSCPTLCDPMDCSLQGFSVHGILQARTLEWVAISFSIAWKWKVKVKSLSRVRLLATPWTAAYQAPPSMGFSGQQYWSGVPLPSPLLSLGPLLSIGDLSGKFGHQDRSWKLTSEEKAYNPSALKFRHFSHCADGSQIISSSAPVPSCALHTGTGTQ